MTSFTVTAVEQAANGTSESGGPWTRQKLTLKSGEQTVQASLFCNKFTPVPDVGAVLDGEIKAPKQEGWLPELVLPRQGGKGGGKSPAERRSIAMQHAQKCAVTILEVAAAHGDYRPPNAGDVVGQVKTIAAALFEQVAQAEAGA